MSEEKLFRPVSRTATRREWIGLAVLALPCLLATMDMTVLNLAVPQLTEELRPSSSQLLWILDIYGFMIAGALITMGTLGDRIGRRRLLLTGAAAFGAASLCAAFSTTAEMLIATRALLGLAGATLAPSTLSLIRNMFHDHRQRTVAIGIWVTSFSLGAAIGPVLGGVMLEHFRWGSVFLLNVPVMVLLLILGPILLPEFRDEKAGRLDVLSAVMSLVAVLLVIYGLKNLAEYGFRAHPFGFIAAGAGLGVLFVRRQKRLADPLIDLRLFKLRTFRASLALNLFGCIIAFGVFLFISQHLQLVMGLTPLNAGLWSTPSSLAFIIGSMVTPHLARRIRPASVMTVGLVICSSGLALLTLVKVDSGVSLIVASCFIYSLGLAPIFTLATDLIVGSAPPERAGAAASISETGSEFGGAVGMAVLGSLGLAIYRAGIADALPPGLSVEALAAARGTLGGALAVASTMPEEMVAAVSGPAREAFTQALRTVGCITSAIAAGMAVLAYVELKRVKPHNFEESKEAI